MNELGPDNPVVGVLGTVPPELLLAAGRRPLNLYRVVQTLPDKASYAFAAEQEIRLPKKTCFWVKCFVKLAADLDLKEVVISRPEPCPYYKAVAEVLWRMGVNTVFFNYPHRHNMMEMRMEIERLMAEWEIDWSSVEYQQQRLAGFRAAVKEMDTLTWQGDVTGWENYSWLCGCPDLWDLRNLELSAQDFLVKARKGKRFEGVRLAYVGTPCAITGLHKLVEKLGARIVLNEYQLASAQVISGDLTGICDGCSIVHDLSDRVADISFEIKERGVQGILFYSQVGCLKDTQHFLMARELALPYVFLQGDVPDPLSDVRRGKLKVFIEGLRRV